MVGQLPRPGSRQQCDRSNGEENNTRAIIFNLLWLRGTGEAISCARSCCRTVEVGGGGWLKKWERERKAAEEEVG